MDTMVGTPRGLVGSMLNGAVGTIPAACSIQSRIWWKIGTASAPATKARIILILRLPFLVPAERPGRVTVTKVSPIFAKGKGMLQPRAVGGITAIVLSTLP